MSAWNDLKDIRERIEMQSREPAYFLDRGPSEVRYTFLATCSMPTVNKLLCMVQFILQITVIHYRDLDRTRIHTFRICIAEYKSP